MTDHYFTFGQTHVCSHPALRGRLADYWVRVTAEDGMHRAIFIKHFTSKCCPSPSQFAFEYSENELNKDLFPAGELVHICLTGDQDAN